MNKWIMPVMIAIVALLMPVSTASVSAQDGTGLSISKSAAPTVAAVGDTITYTYAITNTDNVTISGINLQDDLLGAIDLGGQTSLDAGGTITAAATYTVVAADLPGPLVNTATVSGADPDGNAVTASTSATVELSYTASLQLTKVAQPATAAVGDSIDYTFTIANNGPVTVSDITLTDDQLGTIDLGGQTSLTADGTITATATYTVVEADLPGPITNTATVSGTDPDGNPVSISATATVGLNYEALLQLNKVAQPASATVGDNISYTYTITNNGPVTISGIALQDDLLGAIDLGGLTSLNAGASASASATYTVVEADLPGPIVNTATVSGTDPNGNSITASATATVELTGNASLEVIKSADRDTASPRQTINYSYTVANNGNITINDLSLSDDKLGALSLSANTLAPGESATATANYAVTIADLPGPIVNTATAEGTGSDGQSISATSSQVSVSLSVNRWELFKAEILKLMGVPGKGIDHAPGLQKPFNPKSQAAEHAGPKNTSQQPDSDEPEQFQINQNEDNEGAEEQLQIRQETQNQGTGRQLQLREETQNQGTGEQLQVTNEVQNQSENGPVIHNNDEDNTGKGQLNNNGDTDNQTGGQVNPGNGHQSDKDKKNNKSQSGR